MQAGSSTLGASGRLAISYEVRKLNDSILDLAATGDPAGNSLSILKGNGIGTFGSQWNFTVGAIGVCAADLGPSGRVDLVVGRAGASTVGVIKAR